MNAAALLLPGRRGGRRTPFWLQRLRAKDLLAAVSGYSDFALVAETYRDCLHDVLDLDTMLAVLKAIQQGEIRVIVTETVVPSPVSAALLHDFAAVGIYEDDLPRAERQMRALMVNRQVLADLLADEALADLLRPEAVDDVVARLRRADRSLGPRTPEELVLLLRDLGDLTDGEIAARVVGPYEAWLQDLAHDERIVPVMVHTDEGARRLWVALEDYGRYRDGLDAEPVRLSPQARRVAGPARPPGNAREALLRVFARTHGPFDLAAFCERYLVPRRDADALAKDLVAQGLLVTGRITPGASGDELCDRKVLERLHRRTLHLLREEVQPVGTEAHALFLQRWSGAHPETRREGAEGLETSRRQLAGWQAPAIVWRRDLLRVRYRGDSAPLLEEGARAGAWYWVLEGREDALADGRLMFVPRGDGDIWLPDQELDTDAAMDADARQVEAFLRAEGAAHAHELCDGIGLGAPRVVAAIKALVARGRVTCESVAALWWLLDAPGSGEGSGMSSSLARDLAAWRAQREPMTLRRRPTRWHRRVASARAATAALPEGRWRLVRGFGVMGRERSEEEKTEARVEAWLQRYGVVCREMLEREGLPGAWQRAAAYLHRLELRGQVRRGYFVRGFSGLQFALPEALDALRGAAGRATDEHLVVLNACDPAYTLDLVVGTTKAYDSWLPSRLARIPANYAVFCGGEPVLAYEHGGDRWYASAGREDRVAEAVVTLRRHLVAEGGLCSQPPLVRIALWNGIAPVGSTYEQLLATLGFQREALEMIWLG